MTLYTKINTDFAKNFYGTSTLFNLASTCLGSVAAMMTLLHGNNALHMFLVFISVAVCCAHLVAFITVQKPKMILNLIILAVIVNAIIMIGNTIF